MIQSAIDALDAFTIGNLQTYLDEIPTPLVLTAPGVINQDEVDLDRYGRDIELFLVPNVAEFEVQDLEGTRTKELPIDLYVFLRNDTSPNLYKKVNYFAEAVGNMIFKNPDLGGTIGLIDLTRVEIYQKAEGKTGIKGFKASLMIYDEHF